MSTLMTMDTLQKAMRELLDMHAEYLQEIFESNYPGITADEATEKAINDIATENVLQYINDHLQIMPAVELEVEGRDIIDDIATMEIDIGHGINYIQKLCETPVCLVGRTTNSSGGNGVYTCVNMQYTFLTVDGVWKSVNADIIQTNGSEYPSFCLQMYNDKSNEALYYGLESLRDLIPATYEYVLYDYD